MTKRHSLLTVVLITYASLCSGDFISLTPVQDTTIYQDSSSLGNSQGGHLFSGATAQRNQGNSRRALLQFDVASSIPANATILSAELTMTVNRVPPGFVTADFSLHRLTQAWNEGGSAASGREGKGGSAPADDTTWGRTGFADWSEPGGDFLESPSSAVSLGSRGTYEWPSKSTLIDDLTQWIETPDNNFGWILIGGESSPRSAKRFTSSESPDSDSHPMLTIEFELDDVGLPGDFDLDTQLTSGDIELLCNAINEGQNPDEYDLTDDSLVDLQDLTFWVEDLRGTFFGDANLDGAVLFADFLQLSENFDQPIAEGTNRWDVGDFNCDQEVAFSDFLSLSENFGNTSQSEVANVPEPHNLLLALMGAAFVISIRRAGYVRTSGHVRSSGQRL